MKKSRTPSSVGKKIKAARLSAGLSQTRLAELIGVAYQQIQKYEKGKSELTLSRLKQLAEALSLPPAYFLEETDNRTSEPGIPYCELTSDEIRLVDLLRKNRDPKLMRKLIELFSLLAEPGRTKK